MLFSLLIAASLATLEADLKTVAALPGEPAIVSAAGLTREGQRILTIENPSAFDTRPARLRVALIGAGDDERNADAVVALVRWFKTRAPRALRQRWTMSALPFAAEATDQQAITRWQNFQAADVLVYVGSRSPRQDERVATIPPDGDPATLERLLRSTTTRSPWHETVLARIDRTPLAVARLLAQKYPGTPSISYIPALSWVAALRLAKTSGDVSLRGKVLRDVQPWLSGERPLFGDRIQLTSVAGTMVFVELASAGDAAAMKLVEQGIARASERKPDGIARYGQGWTDDMFMASSVLARASALPGHGGDLDRAASLLVDYAARLQRPDGLFKHATEGPFAWGRGNGFAAFGLIEALSVMPDSHPMRARLLDIYRRHMQAVKAQQAPDGMWREVLDEPGAYREETATAMLATAMARGVQRGWLDRSYEPAIARAWRALAAHVPDDGTVVDVCASTGSGPTRQYYLDRPAITGADDRGGAMALTAAMELASSTASLLR